MHQKAKMRYIILLLSCTMYGQSLHHQMISAQGISKNITDVGIVKQTIGQQSIVGNTNSEYIIMQGFQQSMWGKYIASSTKEVLSGLIVNTYPNPFVDIVNFQFSVPVSDVVSISVFDITGRRVFEKNQVPANNILSINLFNLPTATFLVQLRNQKFNYYTQILKK